METAIWIIHTLAALSVIGLVLIQHGKGADMGAAFGSGSAGSLFGSTGASNFLSKATGVLAATFFLSSLGLTYFSGHTRVGGVMQAVPAATQPAATTKKEAAIPAPATTSSPITTVAPGSVTTPAPTPAPAQPAADSKAKDIPK